MPLERLDPKTGQEINRYAPPQQTIEEIEAYLDYHDELRKRVEEQEERRGGYLGVRGCDH